MSSFNTRILVIDDEESIRESFRSILMPEKKSTAGLDAAEALLFEEEESVPGNQASVEFQVESVDNGQDGYAMVQKAIEIGDPYAVLFCDMRMPGWDGLSTVQQVRKVDPRAEIVFVTAYSDTDLDEVVSKAGPNVSYFCKPFSPDEIRQIATKAVYEWNKARNLESLMSIMSRLRGTPGDVDALLRNILQQVAELLGTSSSLLAQHNDQGEYQIRMSTGLLNDPEQSEKVLSEIKGLSFKEGSSEQLTRSDLVFFPFHSFRIVVLLEPQHGPLNLERSYLVRLFLEQAGQILENTELQQRVLQQEKLSAVGQAISMIAHDMRSPVAAIRSALELAELDKSEENVLECLGIISRCTDLALDLVNDLRDYSSNRPLHMQPCSLDQILKQVDELMTPLLKESGTTLALPEETGIELSADPQKVLRVIYNLSKNATEAMSNAGTQHPRVSVTAEPHESDIVILIRDNGPGIPEDIRGSLFKPFVSKGGSSGSGLGLAIVKQIVEKHEGEIGVTSSAEGTCFSIRIPRQL